MRVAVTAKIVWQATAWHGGTRWLAGWLVGLVIPLAIGFPLSATAAAPESAAAPKAIRERIDAAAKRLDEAEHDAAVAALAEAIRGLEAMAAAPRLPPGFKPLAERAAAVRRRLEQAGVDVSGLVIPGMRTPGLPPVAKPVVGRQAAVSFSRQVAPILMRSCGGCHVTGRKGDFQMASHEGLMRSGMVQRGQGQASRLVEVILTGDMPRGGGKVSSQDLATLIAWIDAGAACDAATPAVGIDALARGGAAPTPPAPEARSETLKPGDVSFATDVAPLLQERCLNCHGGDETENNLSMTSLQSLLKGGRTGAAVLAGKAGDSLLVKKIRGVGIDGQRMPIGRPPLADAEIEMIARWIDQGAKLDMLTTAAPLDAVVAAGRARKLSSADLAAVRFAAGEKLWRRAIPDEPPAVERRPLVCLIGTLPPERLATVADVAEQVAADLDEVVGSAGPLLKGGVVVYAVGKAVDYSALWQNLLDAERPRGLSGHAGVSGDVVYGAVLMPADLAADELRAALADVITAAAFAGRSTPAWFAQGAGRVAAARVAPRAELVSQWRRDAAGAGSRVGTTADFLAGNADPASTALAAGGVLGGLAAGGRLGKLAEALDAGEPFDEAFAKVFRITPAQAFERWAARQPREERGAIRYPP